MKKLNIKDVELMVKEGKLVTKLDWIKLCSEYNLTFEVMKKHLTDLNMKSILRFQKLTNKMLTYFVENYVQRIDWYYVSKFQKLDIEFMKKYKTVLCWSEIVINQKLDRELLIECIEENILFNNFDIINNIIKYQDLDDEIIDKYIKKDNESQLRFEEILKVI